MDSPGNQLLESATSRPQIDDKKLDLARHLFISLEQQVALADRKAQAIFGLNAFLVAAFSFQNNQHLNTLLHHGITFAIALELLLKAAFFCCVCIGTWSAIKVVNPTMHRARDTNADMKKSLYFFDDIRSQDIKEFSEAFLSLNNEQSAKELLSSAYSISIILGQKYKRMKRSTFCITLALTIWIVTQVSKFVM